MFFKISGDGTYSHSGTLAIRAAAAAGVNITYKILFNDAVAMTGGQPVEGHLTVDTIARQVAAEGAKRIALVSDDPHKYPPGTSWPTGMTIHHRSQLAEVQEELAKVKGLSVLIYDQTCAAEKRRRRKRGLAPDPDKRVIINTLVCEGCGDCGVKSNCVSIQPLETEFGRKRTIDQSSCNKDYSCIEGFCPSFVTVHGAKLKAGSAIASDTLPTIPEPEIAAPERTQGILITGVGGTGIVTVGAVLGMAAHLDGLGVGIIDMAGLAQKGGAVSIHMRVGPTPDAIHSIRIAAEEADTVLACDIVVAGSRKALAAIRPGESRVFVNLHETFPGDFTRSVDFSLPTRRLRQAIEERPRRGGARALRRGGAAGDTSRRRRDRDQHADGGLRLAARRTSHQPYVDPRGHPAERRVGRHEHRGLRVGTARGIRSRRSGTTGGTGQRGDRADVAELVERRANFLQGLPGRRLCRSLQIPRARDRGSRGSRRARRHHPRNRGRTFALQAHGR